MFYYFGVGFDGAVGQGVLAGAVDFGDTCFLHDACGIGGCYAGTGKDGDAPCGSGLEGTQGGYALLGTGAASRGEDAVAAAAYDSLKGFERVLVYLVESTVEGDLHGCGELHNVAGAFLIDAAVGGEKAHHHGVGTELTAQPHVAAYNIVFLEGIAEIALAGPHQHMGAEVQLMDTEVDVVRRRGEAADIETTAQLDSRGTASKGVLCRLAGVGANLYFHDYRGLKVKLGLVHAVEE